ncbi:hypothetical protein [Candidatus Poriferisocius sp.]|uniref:hypothetical protein n=1 Tax=Candidatus Poriferisocius sp. TaxID=3101276 RepID=UPI003B5CB288
MSRAGLTAARRRRFARMADVLVAEGHGMPAASTVGVAEELLDRCLAAVPSLREPLLNLLDNAPDEGLDAFVRGLASARPEGFAVLSTTVVGAYYLSPEVRERIGYPGQQPRPFSVADEPDYLDLLERVYERHPGYRACP